ncbi:TetR/AcrR family transcriptional regulator [Nocardia alni]|uniref:TetR/AcrR family transcriptional regulator n=1 Tax=Nocardia alni TaxID=2815723 RepID=UPI001C233D26|nr:TetR family transcriptional regulator [Nocardia alni]
MTKARDPDTRRAAILSAARSLFGANGFERTTIRRIAAEAGVDPALVIHHFDSKNALFAAVAQPEIELPDLSGVPPDRVADVLYPVFAELWGPEGPLMPLLRAASTSRPAADTLLEVFQERVAPALAPVVSDHAGERAALIGTQMLGIAVARFVVGLPPLCEMDDATTIQWLRPVIAHYLTSPAPTAT